MTVGGSTVTGSATAPAPEAREGAHDPGGRDRPIEHGAGAGGDDRRVEPAEGDRGLAVLVVHGLASRSSS